MTPREELTLVEQHISETEDGIMHQHQLIEHLAADGHDTRKAEELLQALEQSLAAAHEHRQLLLAEIANALPEQGGRRRPHQCRRRGRISGRQPGA